jgi:hypothetical protein
MEQDGYELMEAKIVRKQQVRSVSDAPATFGVAVNIVQ